MPGATLIRMKNTPRPQDAIDRAFLEGVLREREAQRRPLGRGPRDARADEQSHDRGPGAHQRNDVFTRHAMTSCF
jgi:hypothetical protein